MGQALHVERQGDEGRVELTRLERRDQALGQVLPQIEPQLGEPRPQQGQGLGQQEGSDGGDDPQAEAAGERLAGVLGGLHQFLGLVEDGVGADEGGLPHGREDHAGAGAVHHRGAERPLQFLNSRREGRLGDVGGLGGLPERPLLGEELQVLQLADGREHGLTMGSVYGKPNGD